MIGTFYIALRNLLTRPLGTLIHVLLTGLGVGLVALLLQGQRQLDQHLERNLAGVDMVVGAKGAPLQLILSTLLHADDPTGNIALADVAALQRNPMVAQAVPLAIGDSHRGYRVLGTTAAYAGLYGAELREGRSFEKPFEAVAGAGVARALGLVPGDTFTAAHGLSSGASHGEPYTLCGLLAPTGTALDYTLLTSLESIWEAHAEHGEEHSEDVDDEAHAHAGPDSVGLEAGHAHAADVNADTVHTHHGEPGHAEPISEAPPLEITALLLQFRSPLGTLMMGQTINESTNMQAAVPAFEIAKLRENLGIGTEVLRSIGLLLIGLAALGIFAALYQALNERRYELALMRAMGASAFRVGRLIAVEGLLLAVGGLAAGWLLSRAGLLMLQRYLLGDGADLWKPATLMPEEWMLAGGILAMGLLAAALPAWRAMRVDVAKVLGGG